MANYFNFGLVICLTVISANYLVASSTTYPYIITDLTSNTSTFINEVGSWYASNLSYPGVKYYNCSGSYIMGGYGVLGPYLKSTAGQYFQKNFTGLPPHNVLYFSYTLFILDSVDSGDYYDFQVDSTVFSSWKQWYRTWGIRIMVCGNTNYPDLTYIRLFGRIPHNSSNVTLSFIMRNDEDSTNESFGFRDIEMTFAITNDTTALNKTMCGSPPYNATLSSEQCACKEGNYTDSSGNCVPCNSLCSSCWGPGSDQCYACEDNAFFTGSGCATCDSSCATCSGTDESQCVTCPSGDVLYNDGYCMDQSDCVSPLNVTYDSSGNALCDSGCSSSEYLYWDGSCELSCNDPLVNTSITSYFQTCTDPCSSGQYLYWNGTCANACSSPLVQATIKGDSLCNYPCQAGQYLYWNGTCSNSCSLPLTTRTEAGENYCDYPCKSNQYLYWNGSCLSSCSAPLSSKNQNGSLFCNYPCSTTQYLYWNGTCLNSCSSPLVARNQSGSLFCNYPCSSSQYLYWNGTCSSNCSTPLVSRTTGGNYFCDYPCAANQYLYWNGSCLSSCSTPLSFNNQSGNLFCNYPCSPSQYLYWNGTCANSCSSPLSSRKTGGNYFCDYPCSSSQYLYWNGSCASNCSAPLTSRTTGGNYFCDYPCTSNQYLYWNGSCLSSCSTPLSFNNQSGNLFCNYPCSSSQYLYWNGTCADSCSFPLSPRNTGGNYFCDYSCLSSQYLYWNGTCASSCTSPLVSRTTATNYFCDYPCISNQYLYWNTSCLPTCYSPLTSTNQNGNLFCSYPCNTNQYLYWNGTCAGTCGTPYSSRTTAGNFYCDNPCSSTHYLYWNGSCLDTCTFPLTATIRNGNPFCNYPCDPSKYLYWNGTCANSCSSPLISRMTSGNHYCDYPCLSGQYLYWNGSCLGICNLPLSSRNQSGSLFCDYPCSYNQSLYWNGSCASTCTFPLLSRTTANNYYCDYPCSSDQYLHWNGSCVASCDFPLASPTIGGSLFCVYPCGINEYLYWNQSCLSTCTSPLNIIVTNSRNFCNRPCQGNEYLFISDGPKNNTCITACDHPLIAHTEEYGTSCTSPCESYNDYYYSTTQECKNDCPSPYITTDEGLYNTCFETNGFTIFALVRSLQYVKYLDIDFPQQLQTFSARQPRNILSVRYAKGMPSVIEEKMTSYALPSVFARYSMNSNFLVNIWSDLTILVIAIIISFLLLFLAKVSSLANWNNGMVFFDQFRFIFCWNFVITLLATGMDYITLFGALELKTLHLNNTGSKAAFAVCLIMLITAVTVIFGTYRLIQKLWKEEIPLKKEEIRIHNQEVPRKWQCIQVIYLGFNPSSVFTRLFYLIYTLRLAVPSAIAASLYSFPIAQAIIYTIGSVGFIIFILMKKPVLKKINHIQLVIFEFLVLMVNVCLLILTIMSHQGDGKAPICKILANFIIIGNVCINLLAIVFLIIKLVLQILHIITLRKEKSRSTTNAWLQLIVIILQQGGMGFEVLLAETSATKTITIAPSSATNIMDISGPTPKAYKNLEGKHARFFHLFKGTPTASLQHLDPRVSDNLSPETSPIPSSIFSNGLEPLSSNTSPQKLLNNSRKVAPYPNSKVGGGLSLAFGHALIARKQSSADSNRDENNSIAASNMLDHNNSEVKDYEDHPEKSLTFDSGSLSLNSVLRRRLPNIKREFKKSPWAKSNVHNI